ncbi:hypothetical protein GCM10018793_05670 [Streptomyces sulfonofaciens]|uniref:Uncharacterized protein n=1 Tax=Streptomyces sulfonofaciens TaxID=68272 RepID=A0A919FRZ9_9ACTN|nr:hypothetical protein [Streptomyces sulfonofaciens]GHH70893.1 hypothetical protein GCM10018793_05670 [Streptomyces sulfonofaciens]
MSSARPGFRWDAINESPDTVDDDFSACCVQSTSSACPIDAFYENTGEVLKLGLPQNLASSPTLGRLLTLGLVTGAEAYFRSIFLGMLRICPLARERAADQMIPLGALEYYGADKIGMGIFEGISFAGGLEVKKRSGTLLNFSWPATGSLGVALSNFDAVCHIRHASVHSQGMLSRGNARALRVPPTAAASQVVIDFPHLQKIALICTSLVRAYNSDLFKVTVDKWISEKILTGSWADDRKSFTELCALFVSRVDAVGPRAANYRYKALAPKIGKRISRPKA